MKKQHKALVRRFTSPRGWAYGLFWSWNVIFLAFMFLGFVPQVLPEMVNAVRTQVIPMKFLIYALILTIIPAVAVVLGLTVLRRSPGRLLVLGYGVEGPLMLLLIIRFFVVRDATLSVTLLLSVAGLGIATLLWQLVDRNVDARRVLLTYVRVIGLTLLLLIGLYAAAWVSFYALPLIAQGWSLVTGLVRDMWRALTEVEWRWIMFMILGTVLAIYTGTLLVVLPIAVPVLYVRTWWRGVQALAERQSWRRAVALTVAVIATCASTFVLANRQPQHRAFALLEEPPSTPGEAQALLERRDEIRAGLLNAYLAPFRYISAVGGVRHVSEMYEWAFNMSPEQAYRVQQLYELVARPLLYVPVDGAMETDAMTGSQALREEPAKAARMYKAFFDRPIVEGEHDTVVRTVRSTWSVNQAEAAWQAVDDREVLLTHQEITVDEKGDWAEVELYEVYQNQTAQRQEVVYYFSLPESAVVTGLWLGNSPDRAERFAYRVAPRGAAQAVYRNEVRYNRDPALVEQIGPRQYRLRIFPVEPQRVQWDETNSHSVIKEGPPLHMWLTWRVLAAADAWPLPRLARKWNVYWDDTSVRLVNGEPMADHVSYEEEDWLPPLVPATSPVKAVGHRVVFPSGETVVVHPASAGDVSQFAGHLKLAVVLDRSRSMVEHVDDAHTALARLAEMAASDVDVYLTASEYRGEAPSLVSLDALNVEEILYYGGQNAAELLAQFDALHTTQDYDAIFILTDGSGYELGDGGFVPSIPDAPVWMVHVGGDLPLGYDDATLEAIQASGGGVVGDVEEALTRLTVAIEGGDSLPSHDIVDGYMWLTVPAGETKTDPAEEALGDAEGGENGFAAFAARRLILTEMHRHRGEMDQLDTLDHLHEIAIEHGIVTPYSSMIVLINERQERLLDELEGRGDRFRREYEEVGETVPENTLSVTGVPEPEEWLLLALAAAMLIWHFYKTRLVPHRRYTR